MGVVYALFLLDVFIRVLLDLAFGVEGLLLLLLLDFQKELAHLVVDPGFMSELHEGALDQLSVDAFQQ